METRRSFIKKTAMASALMAIGLSEKSFASSQPNNALNKPIVLSTWKHGLAANEGAWKVLVASGKSIDAVENGVKITEADFTNLSVGLGGLPDRDGIVTLDASIMNEKSQCGAVAFIEQIKHPISVARLVMEKTPHILLVGEGAQQFALANGFKKEVQKLSPEAEKQWKEWLKKSEYIPVINSENHDTIGMIAMDSHGDLSGACTTSGLSYKLHGRVGDSPIIGAGMYIDNEIGAACATGVGEAVMRISGSFLVVELMRQGLTPQEACIKAIERVVAKNPNYKDLQVGFLALNKKGETGAFAIQKGFNYALCSKEVPNNLIDSKSFID